MHNLNPHCLLPAYGSSTPLQKKDVPLYTFRPSPTTIRDDQVSFPIFQDRSQPSHSLQQHPTPLQTLRDSFVYDRTPPSHYSQQLYQTYLLMNRTGATTCKTSEELLCNCPTGM